MPHRDAPPFWRIATDLQWSACARYLVLCCRLGAQIWQSQQQGWIALQWIDRVDQCRLKGLATFAPDGWHCALATGYESEVQIRGADRHGGYARKIRSLQANTVLRMQFTPDGTHLLMEVSDRGQLPRQSQLRCLPLVSSPRPETTDRLGTVAGVLESS